MSSEKTIKDLHQEHRKWLDELNFYQDEIKFFQNKLLQVVLNHIRAVNMEIVGEYRQLFLKELKTIDDLRHHIYEHEKQISEQEEKKAVLSDDHAEMRKKVMDFEGNFKELRGNFKSFVKHHLGK